MLPFSLGCETTDYEPLIIKSKLREMEGEIEELKQEIETLKSTAAAKKQPVVKEEFVALDPDDEKEVREKLEEAEAYFELDGEGFVVEADLLECSDPDAVSELENFPKLAKIILNGTKVTPETFDGLAKVSGLTYLDIERSSPTAKSLKKLKGLKQLKFLQLFKATISEDAMKAVSEFPALEQIRCAQTRVGDAELAHLSNLKSLKAIDLSDCNRVTTEGLKSLAKCPKLSFLKVWGPSINDESLEVIGQMKSLRVLGLNDTAVTDEGMQFLKDLKLKEVHLFRTKVGDAGLKVLAGMPSMGFLNLRDTRISDDAIGMLVGLDQLKKLDLSECNSPGVTDASGTHFAKMSNLADLNLWSTKFSDDGVKELTGLSNLTRLNLDNTKVTDVAIKELEKMPQLNWLHLGKTAVTDESIPSLLKLEDLKYLNISYTQITEDGFFELDDEFAPNGCTVVQP